MASIDNCTICLTSLNPSSVFPNIHTFPCTHAVHKICLQRWSDSILSTNADTTDVNLTCSLCRMTVVLKNQHSAEKIAGWIQMAHTVTSLAFPNIGGSIAVQLSKNKSTFPHYFYGVILGQLALFACTLVAEKVYPNGWTMLLTKLYNKMYETNISPAIANLFVQKKSLSIDEQVQYICVQYVKNLANVFSNEISHLSSDANHESLVLLIKNSLAALSSNDHLDKAAQKCLEFLKQDCPDLYLKISRLSFHILENEGNDDLKLELRNAIVKPLFDFFKTIFSDAEFTLDQKLSLALPYKLKGLKKLHVHPEKQNYFQFLLDEPSLLEKVKKQLGEGYNCSIYEMMWNLKEEIALKEAVIHAGNGALNRFKSEEDLSPEDVHDVISTFTNSWISVCLDEISEENHDEIDRKLVDLIKVRLENLGDVAQNYIDTIAQVDPDLHAEILKVNFLLSDTGYLTDLRERLLSSTRQFIIVSLEEKCDESNFTNKQKLHFALTCLLKLNISPELTPELKEYYQSLLQECENPDSSLLTDIENNIGEEYLSQLSTFRMMWDFEGVVEKIFDAVESVRPMN